MTELLAALAMFGAAALLCLLLRDQPGPARAMGAGGALAGSLLGLVPVVRTLAGGEALAARWSWQVPLGSFALGLDALSALFLIPILLLVAATAIYAADYFEAWRGRRALGVPWCFLNVLAASMVLVVLARNAVLFLCAWELMSLSSFFLVTFEDDDPAVRQAGWIYLVATHAGTACLLAMFLLLGQGADTLDFSAFAPARGAPWAGAAFLLALVGFGTKAGLVPLHVWLPEAHPAAPSPVSALMSGVMIKTGIYGLVRTLSLLGAPEPWWGWVLVGAGGVSAVGGILLALAQSDLKRLLAYSSIENIGVITLGLGVGTLGLAYDRAELVALGLGGALLHVLVHALMKSALFLGAGAVLHATGTRDLHRLGGLLQRMPWTGAAFALAAAAICGLPPACGFMGELLIYLGAIRGATRPEPGLAIPLMVGLLALSLAGGLCAAALARAFGMAFLGAPREACAEGAHEAPPAMRWPVVALAGTCLLLGPGAPWLFRWAVAPALSAFPRADARTLDQVATVLAWAGGAAGALLGLGLLLALVRLRLLAGRPRGAGLTWDCGYAAPSARMQYTASSFAQPLTQLFAPVLRLRRETAALPGREPFPRAAGFASATTDPVHHGLLRPAFALVRAGALRLRWLQHGRLQLYVLYIALTLIVLLVWKL